MAVMCDKVINLAQRQADMHYQENPLGSNKTKYGVYFDTPKPKGGPYPWFNGKKNGYPWCSVFICWLFCQAEIIGYERARTFLGCPKPADNCAAGVPYLWQYLKARKWQVDKKSGLPGDIIFFNTSSAKCGHVGIIEKVDDSKYYTIEGNKSNQVKRCSYSKTSSSIYGLMRPAWSEIDPKEEVKPEPMPIPEPVKPEPVYPKYKVKTVTGEWLALRVAPNTKAVLIVRMDYGAEVDLVRTVTGEKVYGSNEWAYVNYTKNGRTYTGYCIKSRLKKI